MIRYIRKESEDLLDFIFPPGPHITKTRVWDLSPPDSSLGVEEEDGWSTESFLMERVWVK